MTKIPESPSAYDQVRKEIGTIYSPQATQIARLASENPSVVVTGPFMIGKSESLVPYLRRRFQRRGYSVQEVDCQEPGIRYPSYQLGVTQSLKPTEKGALILDEAGEVSNLGDGSQDVVNILKAAHERNYKVVPIIAYEAGKINIRDKQAQVWQTAEKEVSGTESPAHHLEGLRLDPETTRRLITSMLVFWQDSAPKDSVNYLLETVPANLGVLEISLRLLTLYKDKPIRFFKAALMDHSDRWRGFLTDEEVNKMKAKIDNDFMD